MSKSRHPKRKPKSSSPSGSLLLNVPKELQRINDMIAAGDLKRADESVKDLAKRAPYRADVFETMLLLGTRMNDAGMCLEASSRLVEIQPLVVAHHYNLFVVYIQNGFPALAFKHATEFLKRWPDHKLSQNLPQTVQEVRQSLINESVVAKFPEERRLEILVLHDGALLGIMRSNYEQTVERTSQLIHLEPSFVPAYNNRAFAYWALSEPSSALADIERVLELEPENMHGLFMKVRLCVFAQRIDEARATAKRLKSLHTNDHNLLVKQAEALVYLQDDEGVLEVVARMEANSATTIVTATLRLYAGIAAARLGESAKARVFLNEARKHKPICERADAQLADLDKPDGQRENSSPFLLDHWMPRRMVDEYRKILGSGSRSGNAQATKTATRAFVSRYPNLFTLLPLMLERGDQFTRKLAQQIAQSADMPELWQMLRDFVSSPHGPDYFRNDVLVSLQEAGQIERGQVVAFWSKGKRIDVKMHRYDIDNIAYEANASEQVSSNLLAAELALRQGLPEKAEAILISALQQEPQSAKLQFELALVYLKQRRVAQARAQAEQVATQHPLFAFPRITLTMLALANGRKEEAADHLKILNELEHFHRAEYAQFCLAHILFQVLIESDLNAAQQWLELWEKRGAPEQQINAVQKALENRATSKQWARQVLAHFFEA